MPGWAQVRYRITALLLCNTVCCTIWRDSYVRVLQSFLLSVFPHFHCSLSLSLSLHTLIVWRKPVGKSAFIFLILCFLFGTGVWPGEHFSLNSSNSCVPCTPMSSLPNYVNGSLCLFTRVFKEATIKKSTGKIPGPWLSMVPSQITVRQPFVSLGVRLTECQSRVPVLLLS